MSDHCLHCGRCVNACILYRLGRYSFAQAHLDGKLETSAWLCNQCGMCSDVCPQQIPLAEWQIQYARERRFETGAPHLLRNGYCFPLREGCVNDGRRTYGLAPIAFADQETLLFLLHDTKLLLENE